MVSIWPSQYAISAGSLIETHRNTARSSSPARCPATIRGEGRTATTAVFAAFIWFPCVMLTLTRTSWRAFPRELTRTVIGGRSSPETGSPSRSGLRSRFRAAKLASQIQDQHVALRPRAADQHVGLARHLAEDRVAVVGVALQIARHAGGAIAELARGAGFDAVAAEDGDDRLAGRNVVFGAALGEPHAKRPVVVEPRGRRRAWA